MHKITAAAVFIFLYSFAGISYRFICNGFLADGEERSDECGVCDDENAARWKNPNVPVVVADNPLPAGISVDEWHEIMKKSFAAWGDVSGSDLRFVAVEGENRREFGAGDSLHEIFWITDVEEWRRLVGSGEFGTLGATLPRYVCGGSSGSKRVIFDADLVLNGMSHINWQVECDDDDECISVQITTVHELGHFLGLDHPCLLCSTSVMSARAGYDISNPVFDDMQGLRVLYPSTNRGKFGDTCSSDGDCTDKFSCFTDGENRYCSNKCTNNDDCEQGAMCLTDNVCAFRSGESAGGHLEGESCNNSPCAEPLLCAGVGEEQYSCFKPCQNTTDCQGKQTCVSLEENISLCVEIRKNGETCTMNALCDDGLFCVFDSKTSGTCRQGCKPIVFGAFRCGSSEVCRRFTQGQELCIPKVGNNNLSPGPDINLDSGSHDFSENTGEGGFGRRKKGNEKPSTGASIGGGCRANNFEPGNYYLLIMLVSLLVRRQCIFGVRS